MTPRHGKHPPSGGLRQVKLWADLLVDLDHGEPSITTTAREMAEDVPTQLRSAVDHERARRGCSFRIGA
mgnify:CR=1 FL=1